MYSTLVSRADEVRAYLAKHHPEAKLFENPDYAGALVGWTNDGRAIYDREKCIEILMEDGGTYEECEEFFSYNTEGVLVGDDPTLPVVISVNQL